jgi:hypothetical protein
MAVGSERAGSASQRPGSASRKKSPGPAARAAGKAKSVRSGSPKVAQGNSKGKVPTPSSNRHMSSSCSASSSSSITDRPKWNNKPLRNPPANLRNLRPMTPEPWRAVAEADLATKMDFGSREAMGLTEDEDLFEKNSFADEFRRKSVIGAHARQAWDCSIVKHQPPLLRGQKMSRPEPWSGYHNDTIDELNAIEGVSVTEIFNCTADRDNGVAPTLVQPAWDNSTTFGRRRATPGEQEAMRAKAFRDARLPGARAGAPPANPS